MIGETLGGKYAIVRLLGEGGMGAVYEARHTGTGRRVAVKVITGNLARNAKVASRFEVEARAAGTIESEHVVAVLDVGHDATRDVPFIAMEYLVGEDVEGLLSRLGPVAPEAALRIAVQACFGLEKAHALGIVHRDIKPANIFLCSRDGGGVTVKLLDFGVAKLVDEVGPGSAPRSKLTRTGALIGSPLYMSPEQALTRATLDRRTDIWSLGVVLYELIAGRAPLHHFEALAEVLIALTTAPVPPLRSYAPWVDARIAEVVERALVLDPGRRYQSAREMGEALSALLPGGSSELRAAMLVPAVTGATLVGHHPDVVITTPNQGQAPHYEAATYHASGATDPGSPPQYGQPAQHGVQAFAATGPGAPAGHGQPPFVATGPGVSAGYGPQAFAVTGPGDSAIHAQSGAPRIASPPAGLAPRAERRSLAPVVAFFAVLAVGGTAGAYVLGWIGHGGGAGTAQAQASAGTVQAQAPVGASPGGAVAAQPAGPLARLLGVWKSDSGRIYDAVMNGEAVELRLRDESQFAGQGYENGEARFSLSAIPGETGTFNVEDRVRPLPPERTSYDLARARPTCLVTWTEVEGKPLRAALAGDRLTVEMVIVEAGKANFIVEGSRVVRCAGLTRATASPTKSVLTRQ